MKVNDYIFELISEMEYIIGNETLSKSTLIGGGLTSEYDSYRYPVRISLDKNLDESKTQVRDNVHKFCSIWRRFDAATNEYKVIKTEKATPEVIKTMYYAFGSHRLYIGDGLVKILEMLEERYNINFNELEEKFHSKK